MKNNWNDNLPTTSIPFEKQIDLGETISDSGYLSWLRNTLGNIRRVRKARQQIDERHLEETEQRLIHHLFDINCWAPFEKELMEYVDDAGDIIDRNYWQPLNAELIRAANLQSERLDRKSDSENTYFTYAELYDNVIG